VDPTQSFCAVERGHIREVAYMYVEECNSDGWAASRLLR